MRVATRSCSLLLACGLASSAHAEPLAPISRTDTRVERSAQSATPRTLELRGEFASMRDELENYPVGVNLATPGVFAPPTSTTGPDGFDWGMNNLRGQSSGEYIRVVDLAGSPVGGNSTQALRILTTSAVAPGGFSLGASLRWATSLYPTADHNARVSAEMYISTIAQQYTFEPVSFRVSFITGRLLWGGTCVEVDPGDCTDGGLPIGPIPNILVLASTPSDFLPRFYPAAYCFDINGGVIPGCVPPPGVSAGDPVAPPIGAWARWAAETSPDARVSYYLDRFDGEGEFLIIRHQIITSNFIDAVAWNSSYESQDAFMLVDNIEASGPLYTLPKPPPLDCPYLDDIEWLELGLVGGQSTRWIIGQSSQLRAISDGMNSVLSQINVFPDNRFRREFTTLLPDFDATLANDLVVSFDARFTGNAVRAFALFDNTQMVARVFRGNEDRSVPGSPAFSPSLFVQTDGGFNPIDSPTGNPDIVQPVVGVHIQDAGFVIPPAAYSTITMRVSANGALRIDVDGQRVYAGPAAFASGIDRLAFESENNAAAENAELRLDNIRMTCDAPSCATDFDFDDLTSFSDLNAVLSNFGATGLTGFTTGDANADGVVNFTDLNAVLAAFGTSCK